MKTFSKSTMIRSISPAVTPVQSSWICLNLLFKFDSIMRCISIVLMHFLKAHPLEYSGLKSWTLLIIFCKIMWRLFHLVTQFTRCLALYLIIFQSNFDSFELIHSISWSILCKFWAIITEMLNKRMHFVTISIQPNIWCTRQKNILI